MTGVGDTMLVGPRNRLGALETAVNAVVPRNVGALSKALLCTGVAVVLSVATLLSAAALLKVTMGLAVAKLSCTT